MCKAKRVAEKRRCPSRFPCLSLEEPLLVLFAHVAAETGQRAIDQQHFPSRKS